MATLQELIDRKEKLVRIVKKNKQMRLKHRDEIRALTIQIDRLKPSVIVRKGVESNKTDAIRSSPLSLNHGGGATAVLACRIPALSSSCL